MTEQKQRRDISFLVQELLMDTEKGGIPLVLAGVTKNLGLLIATCQTSKDKTITGMLIAKFLAEVSDAFLHDAKSEEGWKELEAEMEALKLTSIPKGEITQ